MRQITKPFLVFSLLALVFSCSVEEDNDTVEYQNVRVSYNTIDIEILEILNEYRLSKGLSSLSFLDEASEEAIKHNQYMISNEEVSHDYFGQRCQNINAKITTTKIGENVGYGFSGAANVVNAWLNSPGHKALIEDAEFSKVGISSLKDDEGKYYFTNIFIGI